MNDKNTSDNIINGIDIAEMRKTQEELIGQNLRLNLLVGGLNIGLWDCYFYPGATDGEIWWSDEFRALLGFTDENDFPNKFASWFERIHPDDMDYVMRAVNAFINDKSNQTPYDIECRVMKKNGEYGWYRSFGSCLRDSEGNPIRAAGATEVITARKEAEREIAEKNKQIEAALREAEAANKSKSDFLAKMSHEIRTPMNAILGIAEIGLQNENLPAETEEALKKIYESGELLLNIINDILDLSKVEAGKMEIVPVKYDIPSLINDVIQLTLLRYDSKPIEFTLEIDENTPLNLIGDEMRIKQILNNLLSNAFKYTEKGEVKFILCAEEGQGDNLTLIFTISDTGQGMTAEQISAIFDEYTRFNLEANRTTTGTGLGLNITKNLLALMNGEIDVQSEAGKGSVFTIRLPQNRAGTQVCGADITKKLRELRYQGSGVSKKSRIIREHMPYGSVLVVDDVQSNVYVTRGMLLPYGLKIETVDSGIKAVELVKQGNIYDIIFMDHMMPIMDGIEAVRIIREMGYTGCIVALTANALVGQDKMFLANGFDGYISKPIDSRELNTVLNDFIRNKKPPEVVDAARREKRAQLKNTGPAPIPAEKPDVKQYFIPDAENAVKVLEDLCKDPDALDDAKNITKYQITAHGIKSALVNIGETRLSGYAYRLEKLAVKRDIKYMRIEAEGFLAELKGLLAELKGE